jgi:hypothetical protein
MDNTYIFFFNLGFLILFIIGVLFYDDIQINNIKKKYNKK